MAIIDKIQLSGTVYTIGNETTTAVTSASTDNEIPTAKAVYDAIPQGGGGKAVSGGTNISVTTGETADTINCTLPYYKLSGDENYSIYGQTHTSFKNQATYAYQSLFIGFSNEVKGNSSSMSYNSNYVIGTNNKINGKISYYSQGYNVVIGDHNSLSGTNLSYSYVIGQNNSGYTSNTLLTGWYNQTYNKYESVFGKYNASNTGSTDADKSLFSVGNGTSSARHNAFEIRQNGDIYLTKDGQDVKLQDQLGGGGGGKAIEAGRGIAITTGETADTVSFNLPISAGTGTNSLILGYYNSGDSYWNSKATNEGAIACGIRCTASGKFSAAFGYNNTVSASNSYGNFAQGYMTTASGNRCHSEGLGTSSTADASHSEGHDTVASGNYSHSEGENVNATNQCEHSQGRYNVSNKANTTFGDSGNTLFSVGNGTADNARHNAFEIRQNGDIYLNDGTNDVKLQDTIAATAANTTALGGLSLVKLTQAQYDALATKDSNVLYVIVG